VKTILSIAFAASFILMPSAGLDFRTTMGWEATAQNDEREPRALPIEPRMPLDSTDIVYNALHYPETVFEYYRQRGGATCWIHVDGLSMSGDSLLATIRNIRYFGLLPQQYHLAELEEDLHEISSNRLRDEALLTDALISIGNDLAFGRTGTRTLSNRDAIDLLETVANGGGLVASLEALEPAHRGYALLKAALGISLDSLSGAERDEWMSGNTYVGIPLHRTLQAVEVNLERWRLSNEPASDLRVTINVPSFTLDALSNDERVFTSRVIVGAPKTPTPLLTSRIECIVVYPYWHVPRKIAVEEYLPLIQRDTSWLSRHHFEILGRKGNVLNADSIDWLSYSADYFPVVMRQREGPDNALGLLKFVFDNPYAVYLHDTNARNLFKSTYRAYSHGCIRLEKAEELAHFLVTGDLAMRSSTLDSAMQLEQRLSIEVKRPVPIEITYYTCEVRDGRFLRYHDEYGLDAVLASALYRSRQI
jgi:hypothetical protein